MTNKFGFILGIISAIIYTLLFSGFGVNYLAGFIGFFIGVLLVPMAIAGIISAFSKYKNFGKVFGITSLIIHFITGFGDLIV